MDDPAQKITITRYTVRGIELDASGSVSPGWFSRIFEHTRWKVFAMDDFALRNRLEGGVARAGTFEYGAPLSYQDELEILTWVARVGRTSFDFGHRVTRLRDGAIAARARMTVVNLGPDGPAPIEPLVASFVVDEPTPAAQPWVEGERTRSWTRDWFVRERPGQLSARESGPLRRLHRRYQMVRLSSGGRGRLGRSFGDPHGRVPPGNSRGRTGSNGNLGDRRSPSRL